MAVVSTAGEPLPRMTRVHSASARSELLVGIGEFVWPSHGAVWSSTLVQFLAEFGFESNAARKAIQRTARTGILESAREGRRVSWRVSQAGERVLDAAAQRVYRWQERPREWDGPWLVVIVTVPESQRQLRHHLQKRLTWAGLGSPSPGYWISLHPERGDEVQSILDDLGLHANAHSFIGHHGKIGDESRLIADAWQWSALADDYRAFIDRFQGIRPTDDRHAMLERVELVQRWRTFPFRDPDLPRRHLPSDWPGEAATQVFIDQYALLQHPSARYWRAIVEAG